jgi:hypothetical protein
MIQDSDGTSSYTFDARQKVHEHYTTDCQTCISARNQKPEASGKTLRVLSVYCLTVY